MANEKHRDKKQPLAGTYPQNHLARVDKIKQQTNIAKGFIRERAFLIGLKAIEANPALLLGPIK